jgi:ribonuclease E
MTIICINATLEGECRVATLVDQKLEYLDIEDSTQYRQKGNIYCATITSIEESLDAVFVNYGNGRHGFLPYKEVSEIYHLKKSDDDNKLSINETLKAGQKLLVQIEKEQRGTKGAALTTFISLAGAYLVLMPTNTSGGGISKRVDANVRDNTRELLSQLPVPEGMSVIIRTAGAGRSLEELSWDLELLLTHWNAIEAAYNAGNKPQLIHKESDAIIRAVRDQLKPNVEQIIVDNEKVYFSLCEYIQKARPDYADRLKLHQNNVPLFTHMQIENQIEKLFSRKIDLPSGGSIVIDTTEALTAIDVNSASATKADNIEDTAYKINMEAADEAIRQIKLRDIGGIIIIDFIDMGVKKRRTEIFSFVTDQFKSDKAKVNIKELSDLSGIMEISRQRISPPLSESHLTACSHCQGQGLVRNITGFGNHILRKIEQSAVGSTCDLIQLQVPVDIANYMLNARSEAIADIKKRYNIDICILANPQLLDQRFLLKRIKINEERGAGAAEQFMKLDEKSIDENTPTWQVDKMNAKNNQPMGSAMTSKHPQKAKSSGLLKRLWNKLFGQAEKPKNTRGGRSGNQNRRRSPQRKRGPNASNNQAQQQNREDGKNRSNNRSSGRTRGPNRTRRRQNNHETSNF